MVAVLHQSSYPFNSPPRLLYSRNITIAHLRAVKVVKCSWPVFSTTNPNFIPSFDSNNYGNDDRSFCCETNATAAAEEEVVEEEVVEEEVVEEAVEEHK